MSDFLQPDYAGINMQRTLEESRKTALGYASVMHDRLMREIAAFEATLSADDEIAAHLASFGREMLIRIEHVSFHNPYFITFSGVTIPSCQRVRLVQHTSQVSVLFAAVPKTQEVARRIGFRAPEAPSD
jgi:hypothetical protein